MPDDEQFQNIMILTDIEMEMGFFKSVSKQLADITSDVKRIYPGIREQMRKMVAKIELCKSDIGTLQQPFAKNSRTIKEYLKLLEEYPQNPNIPAGLCVLFMGNCKPKLAEIYFKKAEEIDPENYWCKRYRKCFVKNQNASAKR